MRFSASFLLAGLACGCFVDAVGVGTGGAGGGALTGASDTGAGTVTGGADTSGSGGSMGQGANPVGGGNSVGNCTIEPPETCDDCNATSGDGCSDVGAVEAGWVCKQQGMACWHFSGFTLTTAEEAAAGGTMGSPFNDACPPFAAIVGFDGVSDPTQGLKGLAAVCGKLRVGDDGRVGWSSSSLTPSQGGSGAIDLPPALCEQDEFVVGFTVNVESNGGQVRGVDITCAKLHFDGSSVVRGASHTLPHYGATMGATASAMCADDEIGIAHTGRSGGRYDAIGMTCATTVPTFCGDGTQAGFESCEDSNTVSGDLCSTVCQTE